MRKVIVLFVIIFTGVIVSFTPFPGPALSMDEGTVHTVTKGDTLWDLSAYYFGEPMRWPEIWERNRYLTNPNYIFPGLLVVIYPPPPVEEEFPYIVEEKIEETSKEGMGATPGTGKEMIEPMRSLHLSQKEAYGSGELVLGKPGKVGSIVDTTDEKLVFSSGEKVYLDLENEYPLGTELGIFRVEGPVSAKGIRGKGYKKKYIGKVTVDEKIGNRVLGTITELIEEAYRIDHLSEEIPLAEEITLRYLDDMLEGEIIVGSGDNYEFAEGDSLYIKGGREKGFDTGDVVHIYVPLEILQELKRTPVRIDLTGDANLVHVAKGVVIRVNDNFSTIYVVDSQISFDTSAIAVRGQI